MKSQTASWIRKAEKDFGAAKRLARVRPPYHDQVCFHCQKALLQEQGTAIPKTHDLEVLHALLFPHYPSLKAVKRGLDSLTEYAVDYRYPGVSANARKAKVALRLAGRVRREVRSILGLRGSA
jgi:HEPN domain-containing protein